MIIFHGHWFHEVHGFEQGHHVEHLDGLHLIILLIFNHGSDEIAEDDAYYENNASVESQANPVSHVVLCAPPWVMYCKCLASILLTIQHRLGYRFNEIDRW